MFMLAKVEERAKGPTLWVFPKLCDCFIFCVYRSPNSHFTKNETLCKDRELLRIFCTYRRHFSMKSSKKKFQFFPFLNIWIFERCPFEQTRFHSFEGNRCFTSSPVGLMRLFSIIVKKTYSFFRECATFFETVLSRLNGTASLFEKFLAWKKRFANLMGLILVLSGLSLFPRKKSDFLKVVFESYVYFSTL